MKCNKVHEDARGIIYELKIGDIRYKIVTFTESAVRGGHYHTSDRLHIVLEGSLIYEEVNSKTHSEGLIKREVEKGDVIDIKAGIAHLFTALKPSLLLEEIKNDQTINYPPLRDRISNDKK